MQSAVNRLTFAIAVAALLAALLSLGAQFAAARSAPAPASLAAATVPSMMSYQGRVLASGAPFNGTGYFKFAIVDGSNTSFWSNDGSSTAGLTPTLAVTTTVNNGLFTIQLGDPTLGGMTQPLSATVFANADRRLRIWFSTTNSGFTQLTPDQALSSAPFAFNAQALGGQDASAYVTQTGLAASGFITQTLADARYAHISPTTQQIALLKWYTAISGTQADFAVGTNPAAIAFDGANMWVANNDTVGTVSVLRASDGFHVMTPTVGSHPTAIAFDGANMWVANFGGNTVSVLRASDGFHVMTPTVGSHPYGIAFDGANMWVANDTFNGAVDVLRASDGFHVMTPTVGTNPVAIAYDGANMWLVNDTFNGTVIVLRASDGFHVMTSTVGSLPDAIAYDGANMWVTNYNDGTVIVLRASDGFHVMTSTVGSLPDAIAFDGANMWVANKASQTVSKR